jgi:hypothetical protein
MSRTNFDGILGGGTRPAFVSSLNRAFKTILAMVERRIGTDARRGRAVGPFEVLAICAFVIVASDRGRTFTVDRLVRAMRYRTRGDRTADHVLAHAM